MKPKLTRWVVVACALGSTVLFSMCSKNGGTDVDDGNNPFRILDLHVTAVTDSSVTLVWTATGDDASTGTATSYDMRICSDPITAANWDSVGQLTGEPSPSAAGSTDSMVVRGLTKDSTYYFALNACDEAHNCSGISNCVSGTCFVDVAVDFPDPHLLKAIRTAVGIPTGEIHRLDLVSLLFLGSNADTISDLTGLEYCINLQVLYLNDNPVRDLTPLASLSHLDEVQLVGDSLSSIPTLPGWTSVRRLFLTDNQITDLAGIASMTNLHHLFAANNLFTDLGPLVTNNQFAVGDTAWVGNNPLSTFAIGTQIVGIEARGAKVIR
jgi:hypothetical protein